MMSYSHPAMELNEIVLPPHGDHMGRAPFVEHQDAHWVTACCYCDQVHLDWEAGQKGWISWEQYARTRTSLHDRFSHGICPVCYENIVQPILARLRKRASLHSDASHPLETGI